MVIWISIMVVVLVSLGFSWQASSAERHQNDQLRSYVKCQADWNSFLFSALSQSRDANTKSTQALDDLINSITTAKSASDTRAALARYQQARAEQKSTLSKNPLPPAPDTICQ